MGKKKDDKNANVPPVQTAGETTSPPANASATPLPPPKTVAEPSKTAAEPANTAAEPPKPAAETAGTLTRQGSKAGNLIRKISQTTGLDATVSKRASQTSSLTTPKKTSQTSSSSAKPSAPTQATGSAGKPPDPHKPAATTPTPSHTKSQDSNPPLVTANAAVQNQMTSTAIIDDTKGSTRAGHPEKGASPQKQRKPKEGPCEWLCEQVPINVPSPGTAHKVLHPNKDVFVFKVAKVGPTGDRRCKMELELVTPKGPYKKVPVRIDTRETQCDPDPPPCICCKPKKERKR